MAVQKNISFLEMLVARIHYRTLKLFSESYPRNDSEGREWGIGSVVVGSAFGAPQILAPKIALNPFKIRVWGPLD